MRFASLCSLLSVTMKLLSLSVEMYNGYLKLFPKEFGGIMDNSEVEEYRDVVGFEEYFQVSNLGNVFSKRSNRILKQTKRGGYWVFATKIGGRNGIAHHFSVHRLVAEAFIPNPESKPYVNHKDGCKTNNILSNLEWVTAKENSAHARATGLRLPSNRKLTADQVREIRASNLSQIKLGKIYGLSQASISDIKRRETYKDVPDTASQASQE